MRAKEVKTRWKALGNVLNRLVNVINANEPIEGAGIRISDGGKGGKIIETTAALGQSTTAQSGQGGTQSAPPNLVSGLTWHGVKFEPVTIVDPSTCAQSTISVLVQTGNNSDSITINFSDYLLWAQPQ